MSDGKKRVIALGFFDGVHVGHAALMKATVAEARRLGSIPSVMSFDRHPATAITGKPVPMINSNQDRIWLMEHYYGIEEVILAEFNSKMQHQPWDEFVEKYLYQELGAVCVITGDDNHFGDKGLGNPQRLKQKCQELGIGCQIISMVELDGVQVHSTQIRNLLTQGKIVQANHLLGHPHVLTNRVGHGKKLGHVLGFPTVNLAFERGVIVPAYGVYVTSVHFDQQSYAAVTNIGVRPTVEDGSRLVTVEGFILDFHGDLYGKEIRMEFFDYLRPERKFPNFEALTAEVMRNADQTRAFFQAHPEDLEA